MRQQDIPIEMVDASAIKEIAEPTTTNSKEDDMFVVTDRQGSGEEEMKQLTQREQSPISPRTYVEAQMKLMEKNKAPKEWTLTPS